MSRTRTDEIVSGLVVRRRFLLPGTSASRMCVPTKALPSRYLSGSASMVNRNYKIARREVGDILILDIAITRAKGPDITSQLAERLFEIIAASQLRQIVLDLNGIPFITSDIIGQLIMLHKKCVANQRQLKLCGVTADNRMALDVVRFDTLVEMYDRKPQAITAFKMGSRKPIDVAVDESFATEYLQQAETGDLDAQFRLAKCLETGRGIRQDFPAAMQWYEKAARQGHVLSQHALGIAFAYGISVPQDFERAFCWFKLAADQGHPEAQYWVGVSLHHGLIEEPDAARALKWYLESAEQGYHPAQEAIAEIRRASHSDQSA